MVTVVAVVVSLAPSSMIHPLRVNNPEAGEMIQIIAADASGNITVGGMMALDVFQKCLNVTVLK